MPRLTFFTGQKNNDYKYIDRIISEHFGAGGTLVFCHLYEGVYEQQTPSYTPGDDPFGSGDFPTPSGIQTVEDVLFQENRDRKYSNVVIPIRGIYNVNDIDFDARQFGLFLQNDTLFIEFHLNDMIAACGRRLIPGDVIELPHQRDDTRPNGLPAINKYYVVDDAMRAADGYSITWYPHIWRIKVNPMTASQEFEDILQQTATNALGFATQNSLEDVLSTIGNDYGINDAVVQAAQLSVPKRFFETRQYYLVCEGVGENSSLPWIFTGGGDGIPPNGSVSLGSGFQFPDNPLTGQYFLRTDCQPAFLYKWTGTRWCLQEVDWRGTEWSAATTLLKSFINNDATTTFPDGLILPVRQNMSKVVRPRATFIDWMCAVVEACNAVDGADVTSDLLELLNASDETDATYITSADVEESNNSAWDYGLFNYITTEVIAETGDASDDCDAQNVAPIYETGHLVDNPDASGSIMWVQVAEVCDAEDATYVFPGFPILNPNIGYAGGSDNYTIDGLDLPTIQSILVNQQINPNDHPTNSVIVNNSLPTIGATSAGFSSAGGGGVQGQALTGYNVGLTPTYGVAWAVLVNPNNQEEGYRTEFTNENLPSLVPQSNGQYYIRITNSPIGGTILAQFAVTVVL